MSTPDSSTPKREPWRISDDDLARICKVAPRGFAETIREGAEAAVALGVLVPVASESADAGLADKLTTWADTRDEEAQREAEIYGHRDDAKRERTKMLRDAAARLRSVSEVPTALNESLQMRLGMGVSFLGGLRYAMERQGASASFFVMLDDLTEALREAASAGAPREQGELS